MKLGAVLAGKAAGAGETHGQPLVQAAALLVQHIPQHHAPGLLFLQCSSIGGAEHPAAQGKTPRPGDPDNPDGGGGAAGCNCGDHVHPINSFSMTKFVSTCPRRSTCCGRTTR